MTNAKSIPEARQPDYGSFDSRAKIADGIIRAMEASEFWDDKPARVRQALREIAGKMSRIINGDHDKADSWDDIGGYAEIGKSSTNVRGGS